MQPDDTATTDRPPENVTVDHDRIRDLVAGSLTAEFASIREGKPVTYPLTPFYDEERGAVVVTSPPAFAGKVENVRHDPRVSLLLSGDDGEYLLTGDASVRDVDLEANAEYVRDLIESGSSSGDSDGGSSSGDSDGDSSADGGDGDSSANDTNGGASKPAAFRDTLEFLDTWLGQKLMGWYALRIVVEVEPRSVTRVADASPVDSLPAWPAVGMAHGEARRHERAVVTVADDEGYPATRPVTGLRVHDGTATLEPGPPATPDDGQPTCLLVHWHDDGLQRLGQRVVRGRFRTGDRIRFDPGSSSRMRNDGLLDTVRFIVDGKRRTRAYFRD